MGYLAYAGDLSPKTIRTAMIMGSVMGSFAVEQFSVDGLRDLTAARIQQRFDELRRARRTSSASGSSGVLPRRSASATFRNAIALRSNQDPGIVARCAVWS